MALLTSIDPGMMTGIVVVEYEEDAGMGVLSRVQVGGGLQGALLELENLDSEMEITCEKFSPRPGARSWRLDELEPIRIEGALETLYGARVDWRKPEQRKLVGNSLTATAAMLRRMGHWALPAEVGHKDANDVNAAMMHAIGYLRDRRHRPTIDMLIEYGEMMSEELE